MIIANMMMLMNMMGIMIMIIPAPEKISLPPKKFTKPPKKISLAQGYSPHPFKHFPFLPKEISLHANKFSPPKKQKNPNSKKFIPVPQNFSEN